MQDWKEETLLQDEILVPTLCSPAQGLPGPSYARTGLVLCFCMMRENIIPVPAHRITSALHSPTIPASPSLLDLELDSEWQQLQGFKRCLRQRRPCHIGKQTLPLKRRRHIRAHGHALSQSWFPQMTSGGVVTVAGE